jgi:predicted RNA-binding protein with PUA-like domain
MAYWLLKTEPEDYAYENLERDGSTVWDGVSNALALKHLRNMQKGDLALIYHTGKQRRIMGIAEVVSHPYPDPTLNDAKRVVIDLHPLSRISQPVTLAEIKQDAHFQDFDLLRLSRLSVMPVSATHWQRLMELGKGE